jgi:four helix bundle protein
VVVVYDHRDLIIWQLAYELRRQVLRMTRRRPHPTDFAFVSDIRRSARSVASNIAEGHNRFRPPDNHRFLLISRASLKETEEHLVDGVESGYFTKADHESAQALVRRLTAGMSSLMRYLRSPAAEANWKKIELRSKPQSQDKRRTR